MRKSIFRLMTILGIGVLIGLSGLSWAQQPCPNLVSIDLSFNQDSYNYGEPIGVTVVVRNCSGEDLYISNGFSSKNFLLEMRVIDPAGRQILPKRDGAHTEFPDTPPLPVILRSDQVALQAAPCEVLPAGWSVTQQTDDLRTYYPVMSKFPGPISAEVQVSPMIFKQSELGPGNPCYGDIRNYRSLEMIKSEPQYTYNQGSTEVDIIPKYWLFAWKDGRYLIPDIAVTIWPEDGKTVDDYRADTIQLNNDLAKSVVKMYSFLRQKHYLLAFFDKFKAINSLGQVEEDQWYKVVVSGRFKDNTYFGGGEKVQVIKILP